MQDPEAPNTLRAELDRCVKCGMCLPECPTYRLETDENESPRGRLALIEGLVRGHLDPDESLISHLDHCLGCRRCERVCPSRVRYGHLIEEASRLVSGGSGSRWSGLIQHPALLRLGTRLAQVVPAAFSRPLGPLKRMHDLARALPASAQAPASGEYPARADRMRGRVGLFPGCVTAIQQGGALQSSLRLLRFSGYAVTVPDKSQCCGALSQRSGDRESAEALARANREAFDDGLDAVLSIASGCGVHIDSYQPPMAAGHSDICRFLLEHAELGRADFSPLAASVFLHTPCSVENVYRGAGWARDLLRLIPGLDLLELGEEGQCCGAAGDYMLRYPQKADQLRQPLIDQLASQQTAILLTSNVGCAMHLAAGLHEQGSGIEILHPVELLARQLRD